MKRLKNILKRAIAFVRQGDSVERGLISKTLIMEYLPSDPVIVEAGAHIGLDTVELAERYPAGKVYAFEPIPELYDQLCKRTQGYQNISCSSLALSDASRNSVMFVSGGARNSSSSLLPPKEHLLDHPDIVFDRQITVNCISLDDWALRNEIGRVDMLWLDVQGYELNVLKSAVEVLKTVQVIHTEVNLVETYQGTALYKELRAWLKSQGFKVVKEALPWKDAGNVLFVKKRSTSNPPKS